MIRRQARETAVKVLFQLDMTQEEADIVPILEHWGAEFSVPEKGLIFAEELIRGTLAHQTEIDQLLAQITAGWHLARMANVDRNVLRLAAFEILFRPDIPEPVSLNEAIELAKLFGGEESAKFVNGILDKLVGGKTKTAQLQGEQAEGSLPGDGPLGAEIKQAGAEGSRVETEANGEKKPYSKAIGKPNAAGPGELKEPLSSGQPRERISLVKQKDRAKATSLETANSENSRQTARPTRQAYPNRGAGSQETKVLGRGAFKGSSAGPRGAGKAVESGRAAQQKNAGTLHSMERQNSGHSVKPERTAHSQGQAGPGQDKIPGQRTNTEGRSGPRQRTNTEGTSGPGQRTNTEGRPGPRRRTNTEGRPGPGQRTNSEGTSGTRQRTNTEGTSGPRQRTNTQGTSGPRQRTNSAGTANPKRRTHSEGTGGPKGPGSPKRATGPKRTGGPKGPRGPKKAGGSKATTVGEH